MINLNEIGGAGGDNNEVGSNDELQAEVVEALLAPCDPIPRDVVIEEKKGKVVVEEGEGEEVAAAQASEAKISKKEGDGDKKHSTAKDAAATKKEDEKKKEAEKD